ncbi:DUF11 domain-containing protein [Pseudarcicella hirudinis]|nr:DUF11 domain-containing protein [Pseudarcicella hirudinis]
MKKITNSLYVLLFFFCSISSILAQTQTLEDNKICMDPIVGTGVFINGSNTGLCVGCTTADGANTVDGDLSNYSTLTTGISLLGGGSAISVKDPNQYYPGGNQVGFVISPQGGLLNASVLGSLQIRTYRNGVLQETSSTSGSPVLAAGLLGGSNGKAILSFTTTAGKDFDEVQLYAASTLGALSSIRVYYAFEGPSSCAQDCASPLTTGYTASKLSPSGLLCVGSTASNEANLVNASLTDNANISLLLGLGCSGYMQVLNSSTQIAAGTEAGFVIESGSGLLNLTLLGGLSIQTLNSSGGVVENVSSSSLLGVGLLPGSTTKYRLGFKTTQPFYGVRITSSSLAGVASNLNIYYAYIETDADNDGIADCLDKCPGGNDLLDADGDGIPNSCDNNQINISVSKTATPSSGAVALNTNVTFAVKVQNNSTVAPTGLKIKDLLPAGLTFVSKTVPTGTFYDETTGIWNIGSALTGGVTSSLTLTIVAKAASTGVLFNSATVNASNETNLGAINTASACVSVPEKLCPGDSLKLHAPTGYTSFFWYNNGVLIPGATDSTYTVKAAGSYTVSASSASSCPSGNCCPVIVEMNTPPAPVRTNVSVCAGTPATLTASGGVTYLWSTGETTSSISVTPSFNTIYTVTKVTAEGCSVTDTVGVTANPAPSLAGAVSICSDNGTPSNPGDDTFTFTLNPSGGSGTTYTITGSVTGGPIAYGSVSSAFGPYSIAAGAKTINIVDANGCALNNVSITPPSTCSSCQPDICIPITVTRIH